MTPTIALPQEVELKLCLLDPDPASLATRLANIPVLARCEASTQTLHNIYYDTPDQSLRHQRVALRLRRTGSEANGQWLQTLKTSSTGESALSRRGEWESTVVGQELSSEALDATPWLDIDPDGSLLAQLAPCFTTVFERTTWLVHSSNGSSVEVALDLGHIEVKGKHAPICELELELKSGQPGVLFDIARKITKIIAALPASLSKAQRGYLLAQGEFDHPIYAQISDLPSDVAMTELVQKTLNGMFRQITSNLISLQTSDNPELVHQVRIGWRRFRTGLWLFRKVLTVAPPPSSLELRPLMTGLGELRNLDVTVNETLPPLATGYILGDAALAQSWQAMMLTLTQAAALKRRDARQALQGPAVGASLLAISEWLETLSDMGEAGFKPHGSLRRWAQSRVLRLQTKLEIAQTEALTPEELHHVRILAKRLRYGTEALQSLLPPRLAKHCLQQATHLQASIGANRDILLAIELVSELTHDHNIVAFLHDIAEG